MTGMTDAARVAVTLGFLVTCVFCVWRCVELAGTRRLSDRIGYGAHAVMAVSMVAMVWSPPVLADWQMAIFGLAAGFFAVQALGISSTSLRLATAGAPTTHECAGARIRCMHHAVLMAVMVWMFHAASSGSMSMPGMKHSMLALAGAVYAIIAAALLAVAALAARPPRAGTPASDDAAHTVMTIGMAVMLMAMA
jgi:hypothetical protein